MNEMKKTELTEIHTTALCRAFEEILGIPAPGDMAFVRCLPPGVVHALAAEALFQPWEWQAFCVADVADKHLRVITGDSAAELRDNKWTTALLLVDTLRAGTGMEEIYDISREVDEECLFKKASQLAKAEILQQLSVKHLIYADSAVRKAKDPANRSSFSISPWAEFDYYCRIAAFKKHPGAYLHLLGLWPVQASEDEQAMPDELSNSLRYVYYLLGRAYSGQPPTRRIELLRLKPTDEKQSEDLELFLHSAAPKPLPAALRELAGKEHLWVNTLPPESAKQNIESILLAPWRKKNGRIARWTGLTEEDDTDRSAGLPVLILDSDAEETGNRRKLVVRWSVHPNNPENGTVLYRVIIVTGHDEKIIASQEVIHSAGKEQKCIFSNDSFTTRKEDPPIPVKVRISAAGNNRVEAVESEEFVIQFCK